MAVIGSVLVDREMMAAVGEIVRPSDFYAHVHETIFGVLIDLFDRGEPLDKISVAEELRRRGALERVGGLSYLSALMDTVQTAASARYYATIVREKSVLRSLIHAGTRITQLGYEGEEDVRLGTRPMRAARLFDRRATWRYRVHAGQPADEEGLRSTSTTATIRVAIAPDSPRASAISTR